MARAGSTLWLLRHEWRMQLIALFVPPDSAARAVSRKTIGIWAGLGIGMHALAYFLLRAVRAAELEGTPSPPMLAIVTALLVLVFTFMLSACIKRSVEALYERGDLDLLLSSPIASRSILAVRLAGVVIGTALLFLFFLAPFANAGLALGHPGLLTLYPVVISMALIAATLAMLLTLGLVQLLGVRRTRVVAQLIGALVGAAVFIVSQLYNTPLQEPMDRAVVALAPLLAPGRALGPDSLAWLPARAVLGSGAAALALALAGLAAYTLALALTHRVFVRGTQLAAGAVQRAPPPVALRRHGFGRSLTHTVLVKEWRLIVRDPQLVSQVLLQLLYMLPLCGILLTNDHAPLANVGAGLAFVCSSLTSSLAWIIIAAEHAPDLLQAAPCAKGALRRAKLIAAVAPPLGLVSLPLLWAATHQPLAAALMSMAVMLGAVSAALIAMWCSRPAPRGDFKMRVKGNATATVLELISSMSCAATAFLLVSVASQPARGAYWTLGLAAALLLALLTLAAAWRWRYRAPGLARTLAPL